MEQGAEVAEQIAVLDPTAMAEETKRSDEDNPINGRLEYEQDEETENFPLEASNDACSQFSNSSADSQEFEFPSDESFNEDELLNQVSSK